MRLLAKSSIYRNTAGIFDGEAQASDRDTMPGHPVTHTPEGNIEVAEQESQQSRGIENDNDVGPSQAVTGGEEGHQTGSRQSNWKTLKASHARKGSA